MPLDEKERIVKHARRCRAFGARRVAPARVGVPVEMPKKSRPRSEDVTLDEDLSFADLQLPVRRVASLGCPPFSPTKTPPPPFSAFPASPLALPPNPRASPQGSSRP